MPPKPQLLDVPLSSGLDQKTDPRSVASVGALTMQNCVRLKNGAVRKRFGHTALATATYGAAWIINCMSRIQSWHQSLTAIAGSSAPGGSSVRVRQIYSPKTATWSPGGVANEATALDRVVLATGAINPIDFDIAVGNGVLVLVVLLNDPANGTGLYWGAYDASGTQPATPTFSPIQPLTTHGINYTAGGIAPKLIVCGTTALCVYVVNSNTLNCQSLDLTNLSAGWSAQVALTLDGNGNQAASLGAGVYDVAPVTGDNTRFAATWEKAAVNSVSLGVFAVASPFTQSNLIHFETQANFQSFASMALRAQNNDRYWVAYVPTNNGAPMAPIVRVNFWNENGSVTGAPVSVFTYAAIATPVGKVAVETNGVSGQVGVVWSTGYANGVTAMNKALVGWNTVADVSGTSTKERAASSIQGGVQLASRIYTAASTSNNPIGTCGYFLVNLPSSVQGSFFLVAAESWNNTQGNYVPLRSVATFAPRLSKNIQQPMASGGSFSNSHVYLLSNMGSGFVIAAPIVFSQQTFHQSIAIEFVDIASTLSGGMTELGRLGLNSGGVPQVFDGAIDVEPNFLCYPELAAPTPSGAGGSMASGTYQYIVVYEWYDATGQIHQSATSTAVSVVVTGPTGSVALVIPIPALTARVNPLLWQDINTVSQMTQTPYAVVYRTTAGGTIFYRQTADPPPAANACVGLSTFGSPQTISITDGLADATLTASATAQLLYTTSGVLDNFNPPSARVVFAHKQRWIVAGCDEPSQVWPSQAYTSGVCPGFNEAIAFNASGAVRAGASLDDKMIFFIQRGSQYGIEYVTGDGPNNLGAQSDWSPPQQIMSDSGAVDQRAVCTGPFGVLYKSNVGGPNGTGGIFLLSRDLQVQYVSGPVEDSLAANPVVTSMVMHPNAGRVYITCAPTDASPPASGIRLVWDYLHGGWSIDNLNGNATPVRSACIANTPTGLAYHWVTAAGQVYQETNGIGANSYTDAGTWITMQFASAWQKIDLAAAVKYYAVQLQADQLDPADFTMAFQFDYRPAGYRTVSHTFTAAQQATFDGFPVIDVEGQVPEERQKAIQVTLTDAPPSGGPTATTGQGFSWATLTIELAQDGQSLRYAKIPPAQRF